MIAPRLAGPLVFAALLGAVPATAPALDPGDEITPATQEVLRGWVPEELFPFVIEDNPHLRMRIHETGAYPPHPKYREATARYACQTDLDADGRLLHYVAGQPFPYAEWAQEVTDHACDLDPADPQLALKLAWNVNYRWQSSGLKAPHWNFSYERNHGTDTWRLAQGDYRRTYFSHRADLLPDRHRLESDTDVEWAEFFEFKTPFDLRGTMFLLYRYTSAKEDDTWAYIPSLRRVRRFAVTQKSDSLLGSEFTIEDFYIFSGIVPDHRWEFVKETEVLGAINVERRCAPLNVPDQSPHETGTLTSREQFEECRFSPFGALGFSDQNWEKRRAFVLDIIPRVQGHPYSRKRVWYDKQTSMPLYAITYDRAGKPFKILDHAFVWSEETGRSETQGQHVATLVGVNIANLQTAVSHTIQFYTSHTRAYPLEETKAYFDITRLKQRGR